MDYKEIAALIAGSRKKTPTRVTLRGRFKPEDFEGNPFQYFGEGKVWILVGDYRPVTDWMLKHRSRIEDHSMEITARHSALPLLDYRKVAARIEPGAVVRTGARIGQGCIIMMGAVINIGAVIGRETMVDMNAVVGARATVGKRCHIGAGAVLAGVLEPPSLKPVSIGDDVLVGANAVVLEGVRVGRKSVVGAGSVVTRNVPAGVVVMGAPARVVKTVDSIGDKAKTSIVKNLRRIGDPSPGPRRGRKSLR